ncbi:MAG: hypothetical protein D6768_17820 [Chloroflexi bacterium]|nr:MAG: hypothetical protein D6768_17820 [Chloroflexota bacterium]
MNTVEQAIAALEKQRQMLGDAVVNTAVEALRLRLVNGHHHRVPGSALHGERRHVTVMFADISGFTALSEKLDPEEVRSLINACFERLGAAIDRYHGTIDKFIGDEIMALFGAPLAHENDPERALRAALDMMTALDAFNHENAHQLPQPLALHFGINTGLVIAGGIGTARRQDYSVMGDTVNLAARLEDLSEAGQILVGQTTYRLTAPLFDFEPLPPVRVKGKQQPVQVYRLLKAKTGSGGQIRGIEGLWSPLVGRKAELATLQHAFKKFFGGQGSIISVVGEAGLGKSRLIHEARTLFHNQESGVRWAAGRALSHADSAGYLVARHTLQNLLGLTPDTPPAEAAIRLHTELEQLLPEQKAEQFPYLAHLLDLQLSEAEQARIKYLDGPALHRHVSQAARALISAAARRQPLVLVWEDLHWADPSSLELLRALLPLASDCSLLLVLIYRQPIKDSKIWSFYQLVHHELGGSHIKIQLPPLTDDESAELLDNLLGRQALPEDIRQQIVTKAEGNPFYLEEVIRSLIDSGALIRSANGQTWQTTAQLSQIKLPNTLQGVIMARIDRLEPQAKRILQIAAVIGRTFSADVLALVADRLNLLSGPNSHLELQQILEQLETLDLISRKTTAPTPQYVFKHVFTQESVVESLLRSDRRNLHRHVGEAQETLKAGELTGGDTALMLAYHFEEAQDKPRALNYLQMAAAQAAANFANREAAALYRRALALLDRTDHTKRWDILFWLEQILDRQADRAAQADSLIQMQTTAELLADSRRLAVTHNRRAAYFDKISEYRAAAEAAEAGLRAARAAADEHSQAQSLNLLALAAWRRFDYRQVQSWAEQSLDALKVIGDPAVRVTSLFHLSKAGYRLGQYDLALRYARAAQELTRNTGNRDGEAVSHMILGWIYQRLGDYDRAEQHYSAKLQLRQTIGDRYGEATALSHLGWLAADRHDPQQGLDYCRRALDISKTIGDRENEGYALGGMGLNFEQLGRHADAAGNYRAAHAIHTEIGAVTLAVFDQAGLARIAWQQHQPDEARRHIQPVVNWVLAGNAQKFWDPWIIYHSGYQVLTALGQTDTARTILTEAHRLLHQRAAEISDSGLRRCFLTNVETNRQLEQAWQSLQPEGAHED